MQAQTSVTEGKGIGLTIVLTAVEGNTYVWDSGSFGMESWLSHFSAVELWKHGSTPRSFNFFLSDSRDWLFFFFSVMGQRVNVLDFVGHTVLVTMTQVCHRSGTTATDNPKLGGCACIHLKLHLQKQPEGWAVVTKPWEGMLTPVPQGRAAGD